MAALAHYVEVIFVGPQRSRGTQIFSVSPRDMIVIRDHLMELEDGDASPQVRALFADIVSRSPETLTVGDREAERAQGRLITLESR